MKSGFEAMGQPVPKNRLNNGYKAVKEMLPDLNKEQQYRIVSKTAEFIKRDQPFEVVGAVTGLDEDLAKLDLTGRYRLLATLLTD